ncbi:MAG TPA: fatty acid desaturase [Thermoanaerobaculia bacterium]
MAIRDLAVAMFAATAAWRVVYTSISVPLKLALLAVLILIVVRCQRGLENLTHEGSHYNFSRNHRLNDWLTDLLAALPTFQRVFGFRQTHVPKHHLFFGTAGDPDFNRYAAFDAKNIDRSSLWLYALSVMTRVPRYVGGWWWGVGTNPRTLVLGLAWHVVVYITPVALILGPRGAMGAWFFFWLCPFALLLPPVRLIAEAEEHVYEDAKTIFEATVSNVGLLHRLFIHPNGDAYHLAHHLWPSVPHHQLQGMHEDLTALDPVYAASRVRTSLFQEPNAPGLEGRSVDA